MLSMKNRTSWPSTSRKYSAWRFVHLAEDQSHFRTFRLRIAVGILGDNASVEKFVIEIVTFAGTLTNTGKNGCTAMAFCNVVDQFLNENGLAHAGAAEQANLTALCIRCEQIDNLNTGYENFILG
jgi:hypothetical protein